MKFVEFVKRNPSHSFIFVGLIAITICLTATGFYYKSLESAINNLTSLRNGLNICATRSSQSYFAQVNGANSANALSTNFLAQTDECFYQVDRGVAKLSEAGLGEDSTALYDEFISFKNMLKNFSSGNISIASLTKSYNDIDQMKFELASKLSIQLNETRSHLSFMKYLVIALIISLGALSILFLGLWKKWDKRVTDIEEQALNLLDDFRNNSARVERLLERVFDHIHLPVLKNLFLEYHNHVLERAYPGKRSIELTQNSNQDSYQAKDSTQEDAISQEKNEAAVRVDEPLRVPNEVYLDESDAREVIEENWDEGDWIDLSSSREIAESILVNDEAFVEEVKSAIDTDDTENKVVLAEDELEENIDEEDIEDDHFIIQDAQNLELSKISQKAKEIEASEVLPEIKTETNPRISLGEQVRVIGPEKATEVSFQKTISKLSKAYLKRSRGNEVHWEFSSSYKDFDLIDEVETIEQVVHCILSRYVKSFNELEVANLNRLLKVSIKEVNKRHIIMSLAAKDALFNTAELEFFNGGDHGLKKLVNTNLIMSHELVLGVDGDITLENIFTEDNAKEGILNLYIPVNITSLSKNSDRAMLSRIMSGTKDKLLKTLRRETTI